MTRTYNPLQYAILKHLIEHRRPFTASELRQAIGETTASVPEVDRTARELHREGVEQLEVIDPDGSGPHVAYYLSEPSASGHRRQRTTENGCDG